jgi:hypothetical protein
MSHQFIILGMHRSGTSLAAALLRSMGVKAGQPEMLLPAANANPKGFWERRDVIRLNDEVLSACNAAWDRVAQFNPRSIPGEAEKVFYERARAIVSELERDPPWLLKDPRMCLLAPLWRTLLSSPLFVVVSRNPLEIALSLRIRNKFPVSFSLALWEHYMLSALRSIQGASAIVISHGRLLADPLNATHDIFNALQALGAHGLCMPEATELEKTVDAALYRQRRDADQLQSFLNPDQLRLYQGLENAECLQWQHIPPQSASGCEALADYARMLMLQAENIEQHRLLEELSIFNGRLFRSCQYRLGRTIGILMRSLLLRTEKLSLPETRIRRALEQYAKSVKTP